MMVVWGLLCMTVAGILAGFGVRVVRRFVPVDLLSSHNDIAGFIYAVLGVVYAVLLAFVALVVWEQFTDAEARVSEEATYISEVFRDAIVLPDSIADRLRGGIATYVSTVVEDEWPAMARGEESAPTRTAFSNLWLVMRGYDPPPGQQESWYVEAFYRLNMAAEARQQRLHASHSSLPAVMWFTLLMGALLTVAYACIFGARHAGMHSTFVAALGAMIGLILYTIYALDHPFSGITTVGPDAFEQLDGMLDSLRVSLKPPR